MKNIQSTPVLNYFPIAVIALGLGMSSCGDGDKNNEPPPPVIYKKDTAAVAAENVKRKAPIINIIDTIVIKRTVIVVTDSAASSERIGEKMANIYNNILPALIKEKKISITGPKIAWYKTSTPPFFFEAGFPVNKKPAGKLPKKISVKTLGPDSAFVAHYFGPYELTYQAYDAVRSWMKDYNKKSSGAPYEIYVGEMYDSLGNANDPYRVQTDIVFPHK